MLSAVLATVFGAQISRPLTWFGPVTATFNVEFSGNPYDPVQNDVRVKFTGAKGEPVERIAFFDGHGAWKAVLATTVPGAYQATLYRNGKKTFEPDVEGILVADKPMKYGYVHPDPIYKNRFRRDSGQPYFPVGFDLAWQNGNFLPIKDELAKMGNNGVNWTRIWACNWDGKNPWWPDKGASVIPGQLWVSALDKWQDIVGQCEQDGVSFQMTLFHHGSFSSRVDPNWPDHPWNAKNGGFLKDAADFFTDPEAKRRSKIWLRYAVARYGASPDILAWELFNEVQWVDARYANRWADICAWHKEMADYIRSVDPYHHMVTTSSEMDQPDLLAPLDYVQPHTYPVNVEAAIYGAKLPKDKPGFFGEFGPSDTNRPDMREVVRDGIYGGMLANQAGTGMFWYWDIVETKNLYREFNIASKVLDASELVGHPTAHRLELNVQTAGTADLSFAPGGGFEKAAKTNLELPADLSSGALGGVPSFLQGANHRDLFPVPLTLKFTAKVAAQFKLSLGTIAKAGAHVHIKLNGQELASKVFKSADKDYPGEIISVPFGPGSNTFEVFNDGADWVTLQNISIGGAGAEANAIGLGEPEWMVLRLTQVPGVKAPVSASLLGLSLNDGDYDITSIDLGTGESKSTRRTVHDFQLKDWHLTSPDEILIFKRGN